MALAPAPPPGEWSRPRPPPADWRDHRPGHPPCVEPGASPFTVLDQITRMQREQPNGDLATCGRQLRTRQGEPTLRGRGPALGGHRAPQPPPPIRHRYI